MSFCCPHSREGRVYLGPLSSSWGSTLMTSSTPEGPTSQHIALGAGIQQVDCGTHVQPTAVTPLCRAVQGCSLGVGGGVAALRHCSRRTPGLVSVLQCL